MSEKKISEIQKEYKEASIDELDEFIQEYNKALKGDGIVRLDFANAYADAMQIVNTRKDSINGGVDRLKFALEEIINKISPIFTGENIDKISKIASDVAKGNLTPETIVAAYENSKRIEEIGNKE